MSISAESIIAGDITADQEYLWPTFSNLEPSEELRLLRARIAELERQQSINSTSANARFVLVAQNKKRRRIEGDQGGHEDTKEFPGKKFEEERVAKLELENKVLRAELEQYQNKQQQKTIDDLTEKLKVSIDQLLSKHQEELLNANKNLIEEMKEQREMDALKQQKEAEDNIDLSLKHQEHENLMDEMKKQREMDVAELEKQTHTQSKNG